MLTDSNEYKFSVSVIGKRKFATPKVALGVRIYYIKI